MKLENKGVSFLSGFHMFTPPRQRPGVLTFVKGRLPILGRHSHQVKLFGLLSDGLTDVAQLYATCNMARDSIESRFPKSNRWDLGRLLKGKKRVECTE
jgi:hypothetical protein